MIHAGLRLRWFEEGHPDYTVGDLIAFIYGLPRSSALNRVEGGDRAEWGPTEDLLALVVDNLAVLRAELAGKNETPRLVSRGAANEDTGGSGITQMPVGPELGEPDLNDDYVGGDIVGVVQSTEDIARELGWV